MSDHELAGTDMAWEGCPHDPEPGCGPDEALLHAQALALFHANVRLVGYYLCHTPCLSRHPERAAFEDAAYLGLWLACLRFDAALGFAFSTYALKYIRGCALREYRARGTVRVPDHLSPPLARRLRRRLRCRRLPGSASGRDLLAAPPSHAERHADLRESLKRALTLLSDRQATVLRLRYFEGLTLREAGRRLGVSGERVRAVEAQSLARLRERAPWLAGLLGE